MRLSNAHAMQAARTRRTDSGWQRLVDPLPGLDRVRHTRLPHCAVLGGPWVASSRSSLMPHSFPACGLHMGRMLRTACPRWIVASCDVLRTRSFSVQNAVDGLAIDPSDDQEVVAAVASRSAAEISCLRTTARTIHTTAHTQVACCLPGRTAQRTSRAHISFSSTLLFV